MQGDAGSMTTVRGGAHMESLHGPYTTLHGSTKNPGQSAYCDASDDHGETPTACSPRDGGGIAARQPLDRDLVARFEVTRGEFLVPRKTIWARENAVARAIAINVPAGASASTTDAPEGVRVRWRRARAVIVPADEETTR